MSSALSRRLPVPIILHLGPYVEHSAFGTQDERTVHESGGDLMNGMAGVSFFANRWTTGTSVQQSLAQNLSSVEVVGKAWRLVQVAWLF